MKNLDITLAQLPLLVVGSWYIYHAMMCVQGYMLGKHPEGLYKTPFVYLITIGIVLLGIALGLQEVRSYRAEKEASIVQKEFMTKEVVMIPCSHCGSLMPQTSTFGPSCGEEGKGRASTPSLTHIL